MQWIDYFKIGEILTAIIFDWIETRRSEGKWRSCETHKQFHKNLPGIGKSPDPWRQQWLLQNFPNKSSAQKNVRDTQSPRMSAWNILKSNKTSGSFFSNISWHRTASVEASNIQYNSRPMFVKRFFITATLSRIKCQPSPEGFVPCQSKGCSNIIVNKSGVLDRSSIN